MQAIDKTDLATNSPTSLVPAAYTATAMSAMDASVVR